MSSSTPLHCHSHGSLSTAIQNFIPYLRYCQQTNRATVTFASFFNWYVFIFTPLKFTVQLILCWITTPIDNWLNDVCTSQENHKVATCDMAQYAFYTACTLLLFLLLLFFVPLLNFNEEIWTRTFIYINLLSLSPSYSYSLAPLFVFY